jgi:hypothetical protein
MLRGSIFASLVAAGLSSLLPSAALANTETWDLTLTPFFGPIKGTGVVVIETPAPGTHGTDTVQNGGLISMTFTLSNGDVFSLKNATSASVGYQSSHGQEVVDDFNYSGGIGNFVFDLQVNGNSLTYSFQDWANFFEDTNGTFSAVDPPPPAPVPGPTAGAGLPGLLLAGLGLLALNRRRRRAATA